MNIAEPFDNIAPSIGSMLPTAQQSDGPLQLHRPPAQQALALSMIVDDVVLNDHDTEFDALLSNESDLPCSHSGSPVVRAILTAGGDLIQDRPCKGLSCVGSQSCRAVFMGRRV